MAAPTYVTPDNETVWNTSTSPKEPSVTAAAGVLVVLGASEDSTATLGTPSGGGLSYTLRQSVVVSSRCATYGWTASNASSQTFNCSITRGGSALQWGMNVLEFTGSDGIGATAVANAANAAPSLTFTTTGANSAIVVFVTDWNALSTTRAWRTPSGATAIVNGEAETEPTYTATGNYTIYGGIHTDAGAAGSKTVGLTTPSTMNYSIIAIEVLGSTTAAGSLPPILVPRRRMGALIQL